jgi:hypothetical protein
MSDPPGMKRSHDDSTSPHPKRHNTEQSNIPRLPLSKEDLDLLKTILRHSLKHEDRMEEDGFLDDIYNDVQRVLRPIKREQKTSFVAKNVFKANVSWEKQAFLDIVKRAAHEGASEEDLGKVVFHGMCTCYGMDRVMNVSFRGILVSSPPL